MVRYRYIKVIKELKKLLDEETGELDHADIDKAKEIVGGVE
jgi:hypothetical protein